MISDVIYRVFHFFSVGTLLQRCSLVCREWHQLVSHITQNNPAENKLLTVMNIHNQLWKNSSCYDTLWNCQKLVYIVYDPDLFIKIILWHHFETLFFTFYKSNNEEEFQFKIIFPLEKVSFSHKPDITHWCFHFQTSVIVLTFSEKDHPNFKTIKAEQRYCHIHNLHRISDRVCNWHYKNINVYYEKCEKVYQITKYYHTSLIWKKTFPKISFKGSRYVLINNIEFFDVITEKTFKAPKKLTDFKYMLGRIYSKSWFYSDRYDTLILFYRSGKIAFVKFDHKKTKATLRFKKQYSFSGLEVGFCDKTMTLYWTLGKLPFKDVIVSL